MGELLDRFRGVDQAPASDLWPRIETAPPPKPFRDWRRPVALVTALTVAAAGITVGAVVFSRQTTPAGSPFVNGPIVFVARGGNSAPGLINLDLFAVEADGSDRRRITATPAAEDAPVWSPDGSRVLVRRDSSVGQIGGLRFKTEYVVLAADGSEVRSLRSCERTCFLQSPVWSPDGGRLAFVEVEHQVDGARREVLRVLGLDDGTEQTVCGNAECGFSVGQPSWSPDGTRIAFSELGSGRDGPGPSPSAIRVVDVATGTVVALTEGECSNAPPPPFRCETDGGPAWSPDGTRIAFSRSTNGIDVEIMLVAADGSAAPTAIAACAPECYGVGLTPLWTRQGDALAFAGGYRRPQIHVVDVQSGVDAAFDVCPSSERECSGPDRMVWSPDGESLAFVRQRLDDPGRSASLHVVDRDGSGAATLAEGIVGWPAWLSERAGNSLARASETPSPTVPGVEPLPGELVIASDLPSPGNEDHYAIYRIRPGENEPEQLTDPGHHGDPAWSPDGRRIAFWSLRETQAGRIFVMGRDGSDQHPIVPGYGSEPDWSPDGNSIAYTGSARSSDGGEQAALMVVSAEGGEPRVLSNEGAEPSWSPDGGSIVFSQGWDQPALHILDVDTGEVRQLIELPGFVASPAWSPDGSEIAFTWSAQGWGADIYSVRPDGSGFRRITDGGGGAPVWSPDGRFIAFSGGTYHGSTVHVVRRDGSGQRPVLSLEATISALDWGAGTTAGD